LRLSFLIKVFLIKGGGVYWLLAARWLPLFLAGSSWLLAGCLAAHSVSNIKKLYKNITKYKKTYKNIKNIKNKKKHIKSLFYIY